MKKQVRPFNIQKDYQQIAGWHSGKVPPPPPELLPKVGFIVDDVAACFLYQTDSKMALIEGFVQAPGASKEDVSHAQDLIDAALMHVAQRLGFKLLLLVSQDDDMKETVKKYKYKSFGAHELFAKGI